MCRDINEIGLEELGHAYFFVLSVLAIDIFVESLEWALYFIFRVICKITKDPDLGRYSNGLIDCCGHGNTNTESAVSG